uniref:Uncharacterized protein n=1 Tax=Glossina brevipalpis TaxID=37001 RepID=A0A1A9WHG6_9MUSC
MLWKVKQNIEKTNKICVVFIFAFRYFSNDNESLIIDFIKLHFEYKSFKKIKVIENKSANILGKHRFMLHANITPINDLPQLQVPSNKILRAVEGIEEILDVYLFNIQDPDSPANVLIYTILPSTNQQETRDVSDGIETIDTVFLPVSVHPLELRLVNNTDLIMIHKSSRFLGLQIDNSTTFPPSIQEPT